MSRRPTDEEWNLIIDNLIERVSSLKTNRDLCQQLSVTDTPQYFEMKVTIGKKE